MVTVLVYTILNFSFYYLAHDQFYYCNADGRCFTRSDRIDTLDTDLIKELRQLHHAPEM